MKINSDNKFYIFSMVLGGLYFCFLSPFYFRSYEVPDYFLYNYLANHSTIAVDGFSSLFIRISKYNTLLPDLYHFICLASLVISILILNLTFIKINDKFLDRTIFIIFNFSCGVWYYFFGKIYYEFPLSIIFFSFAIYVLTSNGTKTSRLCIFFLLSGFYLSWKPFNIFSLAGLYLLLSCYYTNYIIDLLKSFKTIFRLIISFCAGYLLGNFTLLTSTKDTIIGILAPHLHTKDHGLSFFLNHLTGEVENTVWDHIGLMPFNTSTINLLATFMILFLLPLIGRNLFHLAINFFMSSMYAIFIIFFSPAYPWHSFPFGVFVIISFAFCLNNMKLDNVKILLVLIVASQFYSNFFINLPNQIRWYSASIEARNIIIKNSKKINSEILNIAKDINGCYELNLKYKFDKISSDGERIMANKDGDVTSFNLIYQDSKHISRCPKGDLSLIVIEPYPLLSIPSYQKENRVNFWHNFDGYRIGVMPNAIR